MRRRMTLRANCCIAWMVLVAILLGPSAKAHGQDPNRLIAIDVLLEPDDTKVEKAQAANARLRGNNPEGFALDATHSPHISLVQRYIRASDLDNATLAVGEVLGNLHPLEWQMSATGYEYGAVNGKAITLLMVERSAELM